MTSLLTVRRVVIEPAPCDVLQARLAACEAEKAARLSWRPEGSKWSKWPATVSDEWLQGDIDTLTSALAGGVPTSALKGAAPHQEGAGEPDDGSPSVG